MKIKTNNVALVEFANAAGEQAQAFTSFVNTFEVGEDGWAQLAPMGDFPGKAMIPQADGKWKVKPAIQRIDKIAVQQLEKNFTESRRGLTGFLKSPAIYIGHPDAPVVGGKYPNKQPVGVFANAAARDTGFYGEPVLTDEAEQLIADKKVRQFSVRWGTEFVCEENGKDVFRPVYFISAGLVEKSNLPVEFLNDLAEADAEAELNRQQQNKSMKKKLIAVCGLLGIQFANDADDAATEAALDQVQTKVTEFNNAATASAAKTKTIKEKLLGLCAAVGIQFANAEDITDPAATADQVKDKVALLVTDRDTMKTQFANERASRIGDEITLAIKCGRITEAEKPTWENRLKVDAQFANELSALRALTPKVKTDSVLKHTRGGREVQVDISNPQSRTQFVNEAMSEVATELGLKLPKDHSKVFNEVQRRHPALFSNMKQPEISARTKRN